MNTVIPGSLRAVLVKAKNALAQGKINLALDIIHNFVELIITEPLCTAQVFASRELDQLCLRIGCYNLRNVAQSQQERWLTSHPRIIYIVSRLQRYGGHSRLVQHFISAQPDKNHLILLTGVGGPADAAYLAKLDAAANVSIMTAPPHTNLQTRLTWLQSILACSKASHIYLFNHHQDSVAVAALVPELGLKGSFIHHGDHHLCLGVHLEHLAHLDLHPMGYHYCRDELSIANRYLPLTFQAEEFRPLPTKFTSGGSLTTATAACTNKVEIPYYLSYIDTIPQVLQVTGGRHIHIGKLTPWALRRMRSQLRNNGIPAERLIYIAWTPSVYKTLQEQGVDLYIASFPYGAGLTLIETMAAGIAVIMHQHLYSRVLSGLELAYPAAFRWGNPEDLLAHLTTIQPEQLEREKQLARQHYETYHRPEILRAYLHDPEALQLPIPPLTRDFKPRYDEWAAWAEAQLSFARLVYRCAYRCGRKIRSWLS